MSDRLNDLNPEQQEAVQHGDGPLMIIAGAGTGKTTVITRRIAHLIESGLAKTDEILALTFTEKAATEMEERVDRLLPMGYLDLSISTFHGFCERLLREYGAEIGLSTQFRVLTEIDAWLLARRHFDRFELERYKPLGNPTRYLRGLLQHISVVKDEQVSPEDYQAFCETLLKTAKTDDEHEEVQRCQELAHTYDVYESLLHEHDAMDFAGLILYTLRLLRERKTVLQSLRKRYRYILVDEFQDTNTAQYQLIQLLASPQNNVTVVGDDDQSIYRFRGASLSNILQFTTDYPDTKKVVLTTNYRSGQAILDASYALIQNNNPGRLEVQEGIHKELKSFSQADSLVEYLQGETLHDEVQLTVDRIQSLIEGEASPDSVAILVRANNHAEPFLHALDASGIPYQFLAMRGLYQKPVVMDLMAWLRIIDDSYDSVSWFRVLSHPHWQIPMQTIQEIHHRARKQGIGTYETLSDPMVQGLHASIPEILSTHETLQELSRTKRSSEMIVFTGRQSGLAEYIESQPDPERRESFRHLQQVYERARRFEQLSEHQRLRDFLLEYEEERRAGETGSISFDEELGGPDSVKILTIHASKGLEFDHVFIVNLVDQRFPSRSRANQVPVHDDLISLPEGEHVDEERRLMYVAMTRARKGLYLLSSFDYGGARKKKPSRFIEELELTPHATRASESTLFSEPTPVKAREASPPPVPKHFSFTQLSAYQTCPLQYEFAHVLHVPVLGKYQMSFGKSMHAAVEVLLKSIKDGSPLSRNELTAAYEASWIDEWYPNARMRDRYFEEGKEALLAHRADLIANPPTIFGIEVPFTLKVQGVVIKGQIDRIDEVDGGLRILDYKTGSPKTLKNLRKEQKQQLFLYHLAAQELFEKPVVELTYHYFKDNQSISFTAKEKQLADLQETIQEVVQSIHQGNFPPKAGEACKYCDFADICQYSQH